jgi:hypothetical protein
VKILLDLRAGTVGVLITFAQRGLSPGRRRARGVLVPHRSGAAPRLRGWWELSWRGLEADQTFGGLGGMEWMNTVRALLCLRAWLSYLIVVKEHSC